MKMERSFVAERLAVQHCDALLPDSRQANNALAGLGAFGERFAGLLGERLAQLFPWARLEASAGEAVEIQANITEPRGGPMFNSALSVGPKDTAFHVSLPLGAAMALVDVALGGTGRNCKVHAGKPPLSVQLMHGRFEELLAAALAEAFELDSPGEVRLRNPGSAPEASTPFAGCMRTVLPVRLVIAEAPPCDLVLTFTGASATALFAGQVKPAAKASHARPATPDSEPFGAIALPLTAVLVDMPISVSTLSRLQPGMVIPVSVARNVPLYAGEQVIAHGTVGSLDDRTALQLTKIHSSKEK